VARWPPLPPRGGRAAIPRLGEAALATLRPGVARRPPRGHLGWLVQPPSCLGWLIGHSLGLWGGRGHPIWGGRRATPWVGGGRAATPTRSGVVGRPHQVGEGWQPASPSFPFNFLIFLKNKLIFYFICGIIWCCRIFFQNLSLIKFD
jgi:hypothetical protein